MHVPPRLALVAKEYETQGEKFSIQSISEILVDIENVFLGGIFGTCPKEFTNRISCDLKLLKKKTMNENWMDNTPVPAAIFGPLWPNGAPAGWPV